MVGTGTEGGSRVSRAAPRRCRGGSSAAAAGVATPPTRAGAAPGPPPLTAPHAHLYCQPLLAPRPPPLLLPPLCPAAAGSGSVLPSLSGPFMAAAGSAPCMAPRLPSLSGAPGPGAWSEPAPCGLRWRRPPAPPRPAQLGRAGRAGLAGLPHGRAGMGDPALPLPHPARPHRPFRVSAAAIFTAGRARAASESSESRGSREKGEIFLKALIIDKAVSALRGLALTGYGITIKLWQVKGRGLPVIVSDRQTVFKAVGEFKAPY